MFVVMDGMSEFRTKKKDASIVPSLSISFKVFQSGLGLLIDSGVSHLLQSEVLLMQPLETDGSLEPALSRPHMKYSSTITRRSIILLGLCHMINKPATGSAGVWRIISGTELQILSYQIKFSGANGIRC